MVHKAMIMAHLSGGSKLSADRTLRYQTVRAVDQETSTTPTLGINEWMVGLEDSVAVKVTVTTESGESKNEIIPAKVFRIRRSSGLTKGEPSGWTEYLRPIKLPDARKENIYLLGQYYARIKGSTNRFELRANDPGMFHAAAIVCPLSMTYSVGNKGQHIYQITDEAVDVMNQAAKGATEWDGTSAVSKPTKGTKRLPDNRTQDIQYYNVYAVAGRVKGSMLADLWLFVKTQPGKRRVQYLEQRVKSSLWCLLSVTEHEPSVDILHTWPSVAFMVMDGVLTTRNKFDEKKMGELRVECRKEKEDAHNLNDEVAKVNGTSNANGASAGDNTETRDNSIRGTRDASIQGKQTLMTEKPATRSRGVSENHMGYTAETLLRDLNATKVKVSADGSCWIYAMLARFDMYTNDGREGTSPDVAKRESLLRQWVYDWMKVHSDKYTTRQASRFHEVLQSAEYRHGELMRSGSWGQGEQIMGLCALFDMECIVYSMPDLAKPDAFLTVILKVNNEWELEYRKAYQLMTYIRERSSKIVHIMYNGRDHFDAITINCEKSRGFPKVPADLQEIMKLPWGGQPMPSPGARLAPASIHRHPAGRK